MKKSVKVLAAILATACAVSAGAIAVTAGAVSHDKTVSAVSVKKAENAEVVLKGCDWNYSADSLNAVISCDFNYTEKTAKFIAVGKEKGITNAVLKTKNDNGTWNEVEVKFVVDKDLNVKAEVKTEIPATKEETKTETSETSEKKTDVKTGKPRIIEFSAFDWNYSADSLNAVITCSFDYNDKLATFTITGVKAGTTNAILKVQRVEGTWQNMPVTITVDDDLNVNTVIGKSFITEK